MPKQRKIKELPYTKQVYTEVYFKHLPEKDRPLDPALEQEWFERQTAKEAFDEYRREYDKDQNPLYIWQTFQVCLIAKRVYKDKPIPDYVTDAWEWVMAYFAEVAKNMTNGDDPKEIPQYLKFKKIRGGKSQFTQFKDHRQRMKAVLFVSTKLRKKPGLSVEAACNEYAEEHPLMVNGDTIKKWYYELTR